jgi:hypothetical protein
VSAEPFPGSFPGTIKAPPDIPYLRERSDLVCLGEVEETSEEGVARYLIGDSEYEFERVVSSVRVEQAFHGSPASATIEVEWLRFDIPSALARLEVGVRAVLFLTRDGDRYRLTDAGGGRVDPTDEVLAELRG